jgi:tetratricopeptide (TPR) repeat protein
MTFGNKSLSGDSCLFLGGTAVHKALNKLHTCCILLISLAVLLISIPGLCAESGDSLLMEGEKLFQDFKFTEPETKFHEAIGSYEAAGNRSGAAKALERFGRFAYDLGNYSDAIPVFGRAERIYDELGQSSNKARVIASVALAYDDWGDFPAAIHYYRKSLANRPVASDLAKVEMNLGTIYQQLGDEDEMIKHLTAAQTAARSSSDHNLLRDVQLRLGDVCQKAGRPSDAKEAYQAMMKGSKDPDDTRQALIHLGDLCLWEQNTKEAESHYRKAGYELGLGRVCLAENRYEEALTFLQRAAAQADAQQQPEAVFAAHAGLGMACLGLSRYADAESHLQRAVKALEEVRELLPVGKRMYFLSASTSGINHLSAYEALVLTLAMQGRKEEAFQVSEFTRSRVLSEALSGKMNLMEEGGGLPPEKVATPAGTAVEERPSGSLSRTESVEVIPFGKIFDFFQNRDPSYHDASVCSLLIQAVLKDFDKAESSKASSKGAAAYQKAGFKPAAMASVQSRLRTLKQRGLNNHLTSFVAAEEGQQ